MQIPAPIPILNLSDHLQHHHATPKARAVGKYYGRHGKRSKHTSQESPYHIQRSESRKTWCRRAERLSLRRSDRSTLITVDLPPKLIYHVFFFIFACSRFWLQPKNLHRRFGCGDEWGVAVFRIRDQSANHSYVENVEFSVCILYWFDVNWISDNNYTRTNSFSMEAAPLTANDGITCNTLSATVTPISNIRTELKLFSAVYSLQNSAMKQYILNPLGQEAFEEPPKFAVWRYSGYVSAFKCRNIIIYNLNHLQCRQKWTWTTFMIAGSAE